MFKNILHYLPYKGEVNNQPSLTVPDQTLSMREILSRHARGLPYDSFNPVYHGDDEYIPNPATLDLVDRQEMAEEISNRVAKIKQTAAEKAAEKAAEDAAKQGGATPAVEN